MTQRDIILFFQFARASTEDKSLLEKADFGKLMKIVESRDIYYISKIVESIMKQEYENVPALVHEFKKKREIESLHKALEEVVGESNIARIYETKIDPKIYRAAGIAELFISSRKPTKVAAIISHIYENAKKELMESLTSTQQIDSYQAPVSKRPVRKEKLQETYSDDEIVSKEVERLSEELCEIVYNLIDKLNFSEDYKQYVEQILKSIEESKGSVAKLTALVDLLLQIRQQFPSKINDVLINNPEKKDE